MKTEKWVAKGRVQGVGFRLYVYELANKYRVKGTVKNEIDGSVTIIAQGNSIQLEQLYQHVQIPQHRWMDVRSLERIPIENAPSYESFDAIY